MIFEVEVLKVFLLVMTRFTGLLVSAPVLGSRNFPVIGKVGLAALSAMIVTPLLPAFTEPLPAEALPFGMLALGEAAIGLTMGFVMTIAFAAIQVAGQIMDMLSGFALVNVFNPAMETQVPIFGFFYFIIAVLYLLVLDGHHLMIEHLVITFEKVPVGGFVLHPELFREVGRWGSAMFLDGLILAAPLAGALLLAYVTMGLMGRIVPQIHLFVVGFPFTVGMALLVSAFIIEIYLLALDGMFNQMWRNVGTLIDGMT